jgi:zinc protease
MTSPLRTLLLATIAATALAAPVARADTPAAPINTAAPAPSPAPVDVTRATLDNGLRVVIVQDKLAPVVTTEINYLAGSNDAPEGFPGTAHALEHMMFRGSAGLDKDQLSEIASMIGGNYNADTTESVTQFFYTAPADDLDVALHIESLRMNGLSINQADWDKERGAIEQEVSRDLSSPIYNYFSQVQSILFAGTPYNHDALGTRPSFDKTDAALLRKFYETWYAPNNAILVIAGDIDPQRALAQVKAAFGAIPRKQLPAHAPITPQPVAAKTLTLPTDFPIGIATLAYRMPGLQSPDFAAADVLSDVIGSQRSALYGLVVSGASLTSEFAYEAKAGVGFAVAVGGFPEGGDPQPLLTQMRAVMADIAQHGVSPELVEAAKRRELAQLAFRDNDISGVAESWSNALAFQGLNSPDDLARAYKSVTTADVDRVARQLLDPNQAVTAILTPRDSGKPVGGRGFGGAESFGGAPDHPVALPDWASATLAKLEIPPAGTAPVVSILPNGLRLIVQPTHVSPTVSVFGQIREVTETQEPKGHEGVSDLVSQMLNYGTQQHDRLAFQKALDDIAADEQAGAEFSLQVLRSQFRAGMALLAENQLHPAFPAGAYKIVQRQTEQSLVGQLQSPDYLFGRAGEKAIVPPGDPALREATPDTVAATSLADLRAYYAAAFRPDLTTIVIIGDITPEAAKQVVIDSFGHWTASGATPHIDLPPIPPSRASFAHVPDSSSVQDSVVLTESVPMSITDPDRYTLMLGNTILGGGFSSRLYNDLRVRGGYVYTVDSSLDWSRTRASYGVSFGADPDKVARAATLAVRDIGQMQTSPVSDTELARAKAQTLRRLPMQRASVEGLAHLYLRLVDLDLPLDTPQIAAKHYYDTTAAEVEAAFAKWLRPGDLARVVKGPDVIQ